MDSVDGDVRLSVKLDTKTIQSSADELRKAFKNALSSLSSSDTASKVLEQLNTTVESVTSSLETLQSSGNIIVQTNAQQVSEETEQVSSAIEEAKSSAETAHQALSEMENINDVNTEPIEQATESIETLDEWARQTDEEIDKLIDDIAQQQAAEQNISQQISNKNADGFQANFVADEFNDLLSQINNVEELQELIMDLRTVQGQLNGESEDYNEKWESINEAVHSVLEKIREVRIENARTATSFGETTQNANEPQTSTENIAQSTSSVRFLSALSRGMQDLEGYTWNVINAFRNVGDVIRHSTGSAVPAISSASDRITQFNKSILNSVKSLIQHSKVIKAAKNGIAQFSKSVLNSVKSLIKHGTASKSAKNGINNFNSVMKKGVNVLLKYGLGIRSTYILFNKLKTAIKDGYKNLGGYSDEVNKSISSTMSALAKLKNQLAATFQPIVSVVVPILNKLIEKLNEAAVAVSQFFAAWTGQAYVYKAKDVQEKYVEDLEDTAEAAEEAEKALDSYLSPLDDINKFQEDSDKATSTDKTKDTTAEDPKNMFETAAVESKFKELVDKIKKAFESGDFTDFGVKLGEKLNKAIKKIDSKAIGKTIAKVINSATSFAIGFLTTVNWDKIGSKIADNINTLVKNVDGKQLGRAIAEVINSGFGLATGFLGTFNSTALADKIADTINSFFENIDEKTAGETIASAINKAISFSTELLAETDFEQIGTKIANFMNSTFENIDGEQIGETLSTVLFSVIDFAMGFLENLDFGEVEQKLNDIIHGFFEDIDTRTDIDFEPFLSAFDGLTEDVQEIIDLAETWVTSVWDKVFVPLSTWVIDEGVPAALDAIGGALELIKSVGEKAGEILSALWDGFFAQAASWVGDEIVSFLEILGQFLTDIANNDAAVTAIIAIGAAILTIVTAVKALNIALAIADILSQPLLILPELIAIAIAAIIVVIIEVITYWDTLKEIFSEGIQWWKDFFSKWWNTIVTYWSDKLLSIGKWFKTVIASFKEFLGDVKDYWSQHNPFPGITNSAKAFVTGFKNIVGGITKFLLYTFKGNWKKAWEGIKQVFTGIWQTLAGAITLPINAVIDLINLLLKGITKGVNAILSGISNAMQFDIPEWVPGIGGSTYGLYIPPLEIPTIPKLATGAVIPPNREFLAVLGDQRNGNNIEAPEGLIRQIVSEELAKNNGGNNVYNVNLQVGNKSFLKFVLDEAKIKQGQTGRNPFELA